MGRKVSQATRVKMSESAKKKDPKYKVKQRESMMRTISTPEYKEKRRLLRFRQKLPYRDTKIEQKLCLYLLVIVRLHQRHHSLYLQVPYTS